jgi:hypothetical protein
MLVGNTDGHQICLPQTLRNNIAVDGIEVLFVISSDGCGGIRDAPGRSKREVISDPPLPSSPSEITNV